MTAGVPVDVGRDEAREAAARELAERAYAADDPSLPARALEWGLERLVELLDSAATLSPGGYAGLVALVAVLVLAVVAIRLRIGRVGRVAGGAGAGALFAAGPRTSADHRAAADAHAARGEWDAAVRERFRAVVRDLEERELIDTRAGRTAGEAATDAGLVLPSCAADLHAAAGLFDEVVYGGRRAAQDGDARIRAVDDAVRRARPVPAR